MSKCAEYGIPSDTAVLMMQKTAKLTTGNSLKLIDALMSGRLPRPLSATMASNRHTAELLSRPFSKAVEENMSHMESLEKAVNNLYAAGYSPKRGTKLKNLISAANDGDERLTTAIRNLLFNAGYIK